jgi:hypothetical protein
VTWAPGRLARTAAVAAVALGCRSTPPSPSALERGISEGLREALRPTSLTVRCGPAPVTACEAIADGVTLAIVVERDPVVGERWRLAAPVVTTAPIADHVRRELGALGVVTEVDCGPALVPRAAGDVITCALGTGGRAWARLRQDGGFVLDVALDAAEVAARQADADPVALEARSRTLDSDEASGTEEPDDDAADGSGSGSGSL